MSVQFKTGDSLEIMAPMPSGSIDACVTDPPYGLSFMGKAWDHGVPGEPYWREVLRALKPGGWLLAFGGTRTHHRLMVAIEDAGFDISDTLMWLHGQGFPKGQGQLKPAWEPIILARKAAPAPRLNIDGCRLTWDVASLAKDTARRQTANTDLRGGNYGNGEAAAILISKDSPSGRWPANVVLSHEDGCREVGTKRVKTGMHGKASGGFNPTGQTVYGKGNADVDVSGGYADADGLETVAVWECVPECAVRLLDEQSGASRFYYCAKASRSERGAYNDHPTVKPRALMRWLVRLVTQPDDVVLDPFCGSGTTLLACRDEGRRGIGVDSDPHAIDIARRRTGQGRVMAVKL